MARNTETGLQKTTVGTYRVDTTYKGKKIRGTFDNYRDAVNFKKNQIKDIDSKSKAGIQFGCTYEDLERRFFDEHCNKIRKSTTDRYELDIRLRIRPYLQFYKLDKISPQMISDFQNELIKSKTISPKSINNCTDTLRTMFNFAVNKKLIATTPFEIESLEVVEEHDYNWWDKREYIDQFIDGLRKRKEPYKAALLLPLETGLRLGEVIALDKRDINFELCHINVHRSWDDKEKKFGPTKNGKTRIISFDKNSLLHDWLMEMTNTNPDSKALVTTRTGKRQGCRKLSAEVFGKWKRKLDLPDITYHGLRHTFASWYMIRVGDIWELHKLMGHTSVRTTEEKYAHLSKDASKVPSWVDNKSNPNLTQMPKLKLM